jgi:hypothetical protein
MQVPDFGLERAYVYLALSVFLSRSSHTSDPVRSVCSTFGSGFGGRRIGGRLKQLNYDDATGLLVTKISTEAVFIYVVLMDLPLFGPLRLGTS